MIGFDDPSFDGEWNKEERTQCWFSPGELYDRYNRVNDVAYSGFDWMYTNDLRDVIRHERRTQFKSNDVYAWQ